MKSGVCTCTDLYMCTWRVNEGKKHRSRTAFQAGVKQWKSSVPWKYDKLKFIRRMKGEAGMYFQLTQSRLEPRTYCLMCGFKHCLALVPRLVFFLFGYKSSAQKVRGINTEKNRSKDCGCPTEAAFAMNRCHTFSGYSPRQYGDSNLLLPRCTRASWFSRAVISFQDYITIIQTRMYSFICHTFLSLLLSASFNSVYVLLGGQTDTLACFWSGSVQEPEISEISPSSWRRYLSDPNNFRRTL